MNGNIQPRRLKTQEEIIAAEVAYKAVFQSSNPINNPFNPKIKKRAVLFCHLYAFEENYLQAIGRSAVESGDSSIAYISLIEGFSGDNFANRFHWIFDLMNYPYEELRKDKNWFPIMENAIYSANGSWGIIFSEVGHAIIGGSNTFFSALDINIPHFQDEVYKFLSNMKELVEKSSKAKLKIKKWLPTMLSNTYGSSEAKKMLIDSELAGLLYK